MVYYSTNKIILGVLPPPLPPYNEICLGIHRNLGMIPNEKTGKGMHVKEGKGRKVRSDKKRDVKPTVSTFVKENLYYYAYLVGLPVKDAAYLLIKEGIKDDVILRKLQHLMISNYHCGNRLYMGNREDGPVKIDYHGPTGKVTIKFTPETYENLRTLAFAMAITPTTLAAIVLRKTLYTPDFIENHIKRFRRIHDSFRMKEIERFVSLLPQSVPVINEPSKTLKNRFSIFKEGKKNV